MYYDYTSPLLDNPLIKTTILYNEELSDIEKLEVDRYWTISENGFKEKAKELNKRKSSLRIERDKCTYCGKKISVEVRNRTEVISFLKPIDAICQSTECKNNKSEEFAYLKETYSEIISSNKDEYNKLAWYYHYLNANIYDVTHAEVAARRDRINYLSKHEKEILTRLISIPRNKIQQDIYMDKSGNTQKAMNKFLALGIIVEIPKAKNENTSEFEYYYSDVIPNELKVDKKASMKERKELETDVKILTTLNQALVKQRDVLLSRIKEIEKE